MNINEAMIKAMVVCWSELGVIVEHSKYTDHPIWYISVPEHSFTVDSHGDEMSGMFLAKKIKHKSNATFNIALGHPVNFEVKARVRKGEQWTAEDAAKAKYDALRRVKSVSFGGLL